MAIIVSIIRAILVEPAGAISYMVVKEDLGLRERTLTSEHSYAGGGKDIVTRWIGRIWNVVSKVSSIWKRTERRG
jgi:hypothetical protein